MLGLNKYYIMTQGANGIVNVFSQLTFIKLLSICFLMHKAFAKVEPPNYNFSLDTLNLFMPKKSVKNVKQKYPKMSIQKVQNGNTLYKVYINQRRYKFPVLFQAKGDVITDFYTRLPAYFLHDVFHQSLINRIGKQNKYFKKEEAAVYIWNKKKLTHVYSGGCTITCFPIYYTVYETYKGSIFSSLKLHPKAL